ncbi:helix-turn-helix domain-containing protein [Gordonia sp. PP30]|uniref:GlxA family transcriptional regulator n=1 Tax=Gordonia sp. PP30 TaxID=2935861 RepID=UPI001FFF00D9|nr:helix-turn-helix domain-containing protein [Gordonia sp. PP30]UQE73261.1 helix-turn-helix domain-containing protein [Gordonia sp. PP30]
MVSRVVVLADDGVMPFEMSLAGRVFGTAADGDGNPLYDVKVCTSDGAPVTASGGFDVVPRHGPDTLRHADLVVVAPSAQHATLTPDGPPSPLAAALGAVPAHARIASICLASYVLAAAGHLDGRTATTHWAAADHFARTFPRVTVDPGALYVDEGRYLTAAGATSGIDLMLHLIRAEYGSAVANDVARRCVVPSWRDGGQLQYIAQPVPEFDGDDLAPTLEWARDHLGDPLTVDTLARHARVSRRTFTRRFREATGTSPMAWLLDQRTEYAKLLLETTAYPVDDVAHRAGFGTGSALRKQLRLKHGVSPSSYRRAYRR